MCDFYVDVFALIFTLMFYIYGILLIISHHAQATELSIEDLYEVASLYLLVALAYTYIYLLIEMMNPHSFVITLAQAQHDPLRWSDFMYYSFVTMTTLGFGDILPVTSSARSITILQSCTGILFIAVVLARAISLYTASALLRSSSIEKDTT